VRAVELAAFRGGWFISDPFCDNAHEPSTTLSSRGKSTLQARFIENQIMSSSLQSVRIDDKYTVDDGRIFVTGIQALVRLPMLQHQRDLAAGHRTAGYITGYRGSPLGGFDQQLQQARKYLDAHDITFSPAVNEDLAATALWGTQQAESWMARDAMTAYSASGTARARGWTVPVTPCATPTWPAARRGTAGPRSH